MAFLSVKFAVKSEFDETRNQVQEQGKNEDQRDTRHLIERPTSERAKGSVWKIRWICVAQILPVRLSPAKGQEQWKVRNAKNQWSEGASAMTVNAPH